MTDNIEKLSESDDDDGIVETNKQNIKLKNLLMNDIDKM
jgi:hypothetical protein